MGCGASQQSAQNVSLPSGKDLYEQKQLIGVGNHGRVYRCVHKKNNKQYAIKVIDNVNDSNPHFVYTSQLQLIGKLKKLKNQAITPYYEIQLKNNELNVVMDISKTCTLKKMIQKNGKLTEQQTARITKQILKGVHYLHESSIIHKDLKPNNILMFDSQLIKLSDFALAEIYDKRLSLNNKEKKNVASFSRGESLPYMAPQVIKNQSISQKSDVWSIGCTVVEMLTGKVPWSDLAIKFQKSFNQIIKGSIAPIPSVSQEAKNFLQKCLAINPTKRSNISQLLNHPFIQKQYGDIKSLEEIDNIKISLQKNDVANRISSRNSNKKQVYQQDFKTPFKEKKQNSNNGTGKDKNKSHNNQNIQQEERLKRLKQAANNLGKIKKSRDVKGIQYEDILPQIAEDQDNMVILNNKKIKMKNEKFKTQQTEKTSSRQFRNSIELVQNNSLVSVDSNNRYKILSKDKNNMSDYYRRQNSQGKVKLQTQPILVSSEFQKDHQYFKKPLKLLKKKLRQRQRERQRKNISKFSPSINDETIPTQEQQRQQDQEQNVELHKQSKIRTISEHTKQEIAINTKLAKAERDRYINEQLIMKRQREQQKMRWEQQLQKESEIIKKQFSHRYAYQNYHPVFQ